MIKTENKTMRIGVIIAVIALITLIGLAGTFAKYVSTGSGQDAARVAKWGVNISDDIDVALFKDVYTYNGVKVAESDTSGQNIFAPGTNNGDGTVITLAEFTGQPPEVRYNFGVKLAVTDAQADNASFKALDDLIKQGHFSLTATGMGKTFDAQGLGGLQQFIDAINADLTGFNETCAPNTYPTGSVGPDIKITVKWAWIFDNSAAEPGWDALDTSYGNDAALGNIQNLTFKFTVGATQVQS